MEPYGIGPVLKTRRVGYLPPNTGNSERAGWSVRKASRLPPATPRRGNRKRRTRTRKRTRRGRRRTRTRTRRRRWRAKRLLLKLEREKRAARGQFQLPFLQSIAIFSKRNSGKKVIHSGRVWTEQNRKLEQKWKRNFFKYFFFRFLYLFLFIFFNQLRNEAEKYRWCDNTSGAGNTGTNRRIAL